VTILLFTATIWITIYIDCKNNRNCHYENSGLLRLYQFFFVEATKSLRVYFLNKMLHWRLFLWTRLFHERSNASSSMKRSTQAFNSFLKKGTHFRWHLEYRNGHWHKRVCFVLCTPLSTTVWTARFDWCTWEKEVDGKMFLRSEMNDICKIHRNPPITGILLANWTAFPFASARCLFNDWR